MGLSFLVTGFKGARVLSSLVGHVVREAPGFPPPPKTMPATFSLFSAEFSIIENVAGLGEGGRDEVRTDGPLDRRAGVALRDEPCLR